MHRMADKRKIVFVVSPNTLVGRSSVTSLPFSCHCTASACPVLFRPILTAGGVCGSLAAQCKVRRADGSAQRGAILSSDANTKTTRSESELWMWMRSLCEFPFYSILPITQSTSCGLWWSRAFGEHLPFAALLPAQLIPSAQFCGCVLWLMTDWWIPPDQTIQLQTIGIGSVTPHSIHCQHPNRWPPAG